MYVNIALVLRCKEGGMYGTVSGHNDTAQRVPARREPVGGSPLVQSIIEKMMFSMWAVSNRIVPMYRLKIPRPASHQASLMKPRAGHGVQSEYSGGVGFTALGKACVQCMLRWGGVVTHICGQQAQVLEKKLHLRNVAELI